MVVCFFFLFPLFLPTDVKRWIEMPRPTEYTRKNLSRTRQRLVNMVIPEYQRSTRRPENDNETIMRMLDEKGIRGIIY